jgi:hypothetical protein
MYSQAFVTLLADARIEDLRRARGTSMQPHGPREPRHPRAAAPRGLLSRVGVRRLAFAAPSRTTSGPPAP